MHRQSSENCRADVSSWGAFASIRGLPNRESIFRKLNWRLARYPTAIRKQHTAVASAKLHPSRSGVTTVEHLISDCGYDNFSRMVGSRRHFLSTIAFGGATVGSVSANALGKPIGLQLYTVDAELQKDFSGTLMNVAQIGIKEVEIAGLYGKTAAEWKAALSNSGLSCRSVHVYDANQSPEEVMNFASALGAKYVVTSLNPPPKIMAKIAGIKDDWVPLIKAVEGMTLDDWKKSLSITSQLGEQAAKHGLAYAYHNHNVEFRKFGDTTIFDMLLASTNSATVKFEMDCGWTSAAGYNPAMFLNKYPDRICMLHIKAFQAGPP